MVDLKDRDEKAPNGNGVYASGESIVIRPLGVSHYALSISYRHWLRGSIPALNSSSDKASVLATLPRTLDQLVPFPHQHAISALGIGLYHLPAFSLDQL